MGEWYGNSAREGFQTEELDDCEQRLGIKLPATLREWYGLFGRREDVWNLQDKFLGPQEIDDEGGVLQFYIENQAVTAWGVIISDLEKDDPPVAWRNAEGEWEPQSSSVSEFALHMFALSLQFSAPVRVYGIANQACRERIVTGLPRLGFPDFGWCGFQLFGYRDLVVNLDGIDHVTVVALTERALRPFQELVNEQDFEVLERTPSLDAGRLIYSPNGEVYVEFGEDFGEISMGSPEFGEIRIRRVDDVEKDEFRLFAKKKEPNVVDFGERLFSGAAIFSPDSRFVALEQLVEGRPLRTQLMVVNVERGKIFFAAAPSIGTVTPVRWEGWNKVVYSEWQYYGQPVLREWLVPDEK